ncbi:MAG: glycosyltransferase family 2 protein [Vicinamibacterales bacterium]
MSAPRWPRISIVTPSFNQGPFLEQAIQSVLTQAYPDIELIVMDGGSTDGSVEILTKYGPRLKHWVSAADQGPAGALNRGFQFATGEILGVINADDFYLPNAFTRVAQEFAAHPSADVISGHAYFARPSGELGQPTFSDRWNLRHFQYGACVLVQQSTFFRRAAFERAGGFRETGSLCWDMELWADLARRGAAFHTLDAFLAAFRLHPGSISGNVDFRTRRRDHARVVMAEMRGRPESQIDRILHVFHRFLKFSRHPRRTLQQRSYFRSVLRRWRL